MVNVKRNHTYENWAHTLKFKPDRFSEPETEEQVIQIVKEAAARGGRVRTRGGGHSWSHFVVTDDTLLQLDKLNKSLVNDVRENRYTVEAGIRLKDLIRNMELGGKAMRNLGSITEQSIAGAISTGTHGTGVKLRNLSASIVEMNLVTGTGDLLTIKDTELLDAARVSMGALGIVTKVTLDVVPMYELEHVTYRYVAADQSLMSPARGQDVCYIGVSTQPNANEVYARVEPIMKDLGGRPHWGKHFTLRRSEVEAMYPDSYEKFRQIRKQLDPQGVFTNTLLSQLFD